MGLIQSPLVLRELKELYLNLYTIVQNLSLVLIENVQVGNTNSNLVDLDPDKLMFERVFLSPAINGEAWMASIGNEVYKFYFDIISVSTINMMSV